MRKDFDYVTMEDYSRDTAELATQAGNALRAQRGELEAKERERVRLERNAKKIIAELVIAAGGELTIPMPNFYSDNFELEIWRNEAMNEIRYRAKRR